MTMIRISTHSWLRFILVVATVSAATYVVVGQRCPNEHATTHEQPLRPTYISMPSSEWMRNTGGSDGAGLCVFTSIQHSFKYHNLGPGYDSFRRWMERHPGGGWPEKVDRVVREYCREHNLPEPTYVQIVGSNNYQFAVKLIKESLSQGYLPCITWGTDCTTYNNARIAHMVNVVYLDDEWGAICDNNAPHRILWVRRSDFDRNVCLGGFWAIIFVDGGAIPCPR